MKLHLDSARGYYLSRVGLNIMNLQLVNIQCYLNCIFLQHLLTIHLLTYQPPVVLRQFQEHQLTSLVITAEVEWSCNTCPLI